MPREAVRLGAAEQVVPLRLMAEAILGERRRPANGPATAVHVA
jgi:chemotaxis response regulator CheB